MRLEFAAAVLLLLGAANVGMAQSRLPADGGTTTSLGQPGPWSWSLGVALGLRDERKSTTSGVGEARIGVYHELLSGALGVGGIQGELYNQSINAKYAAGVRARFVSQFTGIALGADLSITDQRVRPIFTYVHPVRRGGLFGDGSVMRFDLVTGPQHSMTLGVEKPMFRRIPMGTTRPRADVVKLPRSVLAPAAPLPELAALRESIARAYDAARMIQRLAVPWVDHKGGGGAASDNAVVARLEAIKRSASVGGSVRTIDVETQRLHDAIDQAFALALVSSGSPMQDATAQGRLIGTQARRILLGEVLFPYNRLLGQAKEHDSTHGLDVMARGAFLRWMRIESRLPTTSSSALLSVFDAMLDMVEETRAATRREWGTSRFVWLPLQLGLRAEQYDSQAELDDVVEQATGEAFTEGNSVSYVINEQFQSQLSRTVLAAKEYNVLWTHDFRGYDAKGEPDEMSFRQVLRSYLAAMTARVRMYDSTGTFPSYFILLDEWFYEVNQGRLWMDLLEDPTRHRVRLPPKYRFMEDSLRVAQDRLRAAIDESVLLTAHRRQYGDAWFRNLVKVHVSITNASDPSFWSWGVVSRFPLPDTWMRDHRKIVFYDVTETDPFRGEAILTGAGIGEHYANQAWEDRSLLVRGPVLLALKSAARESMRKQGIAAANIPAALQERAFAVDYTSRVMNDGRGDSRRLRAMQLHNGTGFDDKEINVAKAVLYTLMPAGSVIKIPDSLWNGTFWGSALIGAAMRGVRVVIIAPSLENAPARAFGSMVRSRELLWRLVMAARVLSAEIAATGGLLKVGVYTSTLPISDITGRLIATNKVLGEHAWLRELMQFPSTVYAGLAEVATEQREARLLSGQQDSTFDDFQSEGRALLHLKANFFASREAWTLMARPEWVEVTRNFARQREAEVRAHSVTLTTPADAPDSSQTAGDAMVRRWQQSMPESDRARVLFYTVLGSANQNDRSMVSDGEAALVLSNWPAVVPYLDLLSLIGQCDWIDDPAALDSLLPRQGGLRTRFAHWFKHVF